MEQNPIRMCIDREVPLELYHEAMRLAIEENPENAPIINTRGLAVEEELLTGIDSTRLAALTNKIWRPGRELRIHFMDGDSRIQQRVSNLAKYWLSYANIRFRFVNDPDAEIRITFSQPGSWSYIGTDALAIPKHQPTMNFGWLTGATSDDEYRRVVLHEFGHVLGCIHEHQNPSTNIPWDKEAVYKFYGDAPTHWTREQVNTNFFSRYSSNITQYSQFDRHSIMLYPVDNNLTHGNYEVQWNRDLTPTDKSFIGSLYPFSGMDFGNTVHRPEVMRRFDVYSHRFSEEKRTQTQMADTQASRSVEDNNSKNLIPASYALEAVTDKARDTVVEKYSDVKVCIDRELPLELYHEAMEVAIQENPANMPTINSRQLLPGVTYTPTRLAALTGKMWRPERELKIYFMDGEDEVKDRITNIAEEWLKYANIRFTFGNDPASEIRITFKQAGSWSYIGTDALLITRNQATMNFGWLTANTADDEYRRVVLHEFGHVLGCIHEHQNPSTDIPWDKEAVYEFYGAPPNNWSRNQVDINFFTRYAADITQYSDFDRESIMLYPIDNRFTEGDFAVGWNRELTEQDKRFMSSLYPYQETQITELILDGAAINASISEFGEIDTYTIQITDTGSYQIETAGTTDVVLTLFGPDNETRFIAQDDDGGSRLNARIIMPLTPGKYTARVRHFSKRRKGDYQIYVRSV